MDNIKVQMNTVKSNSEDKLKTGLKTLKQNMKVLRERILTIQSKLSMASDCSYYNPQEKERLEKLYEETTQPQKIVGKIEEVRGKLDELQEKRSNITPAVPSEAFNEMSNEEKRRVIAIMREQTKGIYSLTKNTKKNAYKLETIELIIDNIKKERSKAASNDKYYTFN
jgi:hypothetical protein